MVVDLARDRHLQEEWVNTSHQPRLLGIDEERNKPPVCLDAGQRDIQRKQQEDEEGRRRVVDGERMLKEEEARKLAA